MCKTFTDNNKLADAYLQNCQATKTKLQKATLQNNQAQTKIAKLSSANCKINCKLSITQQPTTQNVSNLLQYCQKRSQPINRLQKTNIAMKTLSNKYQQLLKLQQQKQSHKYQLIINNDHKTIKNNATIINSYSNNH